MRKGLHIFCQIFILLFVVFSSKAQLMPATVNTVLQPPYSLYLEDYSAPGSNKLIANILFNDHNEPSWNARLRITIESDRIKLQTRPDFIPVDPIVLVPGVMSSISGSQLEPYLRMNNLLISGASDQLKKNGRLPEGMYKFCVDVLDYESGSPIAFTSCASAWLNLLDPPRIISPTCGQFIRPGNPQNIVFQWHLTGLSPNLSMGVEYQVVVHELLDVREDPKSAIINGKTLPIFTSEWVANTQYLYNMAAPMLDVGKIYVYYVQVRDVGGRDLFKNNGISEICWFYYGWPENTWLHLQEPINRFKFPKSQWPVFSWTAPDVHAPGQPFQYHLKIVKMLPGQDSLQAIENNPAWREYDLAVTMGLLGETKKLDSRLEPSADYAWQVTAMSETQKVAISEIFTFRGPPVMDYLSAGGHMVRVLSTENTDVNDLKGTGRLKIGLNDSVDVSFEHISATDMVNYYLLTSGQLHYTFPNKKEIKLNPALPENKDAFFYAEKLVVDKDGLRLYGETKWPLPHPVNSPDKAYVVAQPTWYDFDDYVVKGQGFLNDQNNFELLEPLGFKLKLKADDSYFLVYDGIYRIYVSGSILLPEKVNGVKDGRLEFPFDENQQLFYIEQAISKEVRFQLVENTGIQMSPDFYVIDFSETESPEKKSSSKTWKGLYIDKYTVHYKKNIDKFKQLEFEKDFNEDLELTTTNSYKNWVDQDGLDFQLVKTLDFTSTSFNTFPAKQKKLQLKIENNAVTDSWMKGSIKIPIISEKEDFEYTVPLTERGFTTGNLDEDLTGTKFTFNKDGGEQLMNIDITRAVFANQEKLVMTVDMEWPHLNANLKNVKGFSVWGDYNIGFNKPNGAVQIDKQTKASVNGYPITVDVIGGGRQYNMYSLGGSGKIVLGDDNITGPDGPTEVNLYSINTNAALDPNVKIGASANVSGGVNGVSVSEADMKLAAEQKLNAAFSANGDLTANLNTNVKFDIDGNISLDPKFNVNFNPELNINSFGQVPNFSLDALQGLMTQMVAFLPEEKRADAIQVIAYMPKLDAEIQMKAFKELCDMKKLAAKLIRIKVEKLISDLLEPISLEVKKLEAKIDLEVDKVLVKVNVQIEALIGELIDDIAVGVVDLAEAQGFDISAELNEVKISLKTSLTNQITASLKTSIKTNFTGKFTGIINEKLLGGVRANLSDKLVNLGLSILDSKASAPKIDNIMSGMDKVFADAGMEIINSLDVKSLEGSFKSMANDLIAGIDAKIIFKNMVDQLLVSGTKKIVEAYVEENINALTSELGGEVLGNLAANVDLDFSNLDQKIKNGDISGIIKFDPTNIKIETSIAIVQGTIRFKNDDPEWGDAWGGKLAADVKIQPAFAAHAEFMNGKKDGLSFWFFDVGVSKLNIPMAPTPFIFDGADGRVYHHMQVNNIGSHIVSNAVDYGANLQLNFYDSPMQGGIIKFDVGAKVETIPGGFYMGLLGNATVGNFSGFSLAKGTGELSYNSVEKHFLGIFDVSTNTSPLLCAGGSLGVDVSKSNWIIYIGKREDPITVNPLCGGAFRTDGWFVINKKGIDLGMHIREALKISSPWIDLGIIDVKPFAEAGFDFHAEAIIQWNPSFGIAKAEVGVEMWAGVGCEYDWPWPGGDGTWYLARVSLGGNLGFQTIEETKVWGQMHGEVDIIGIGVGFSLNAEHTF